MFCLRIEEFNFKYVELLVSDIVWKPKIDSGLVEYICGTLHYPTSFHFRVHGGVWRSIACIVLSWGSLWNNCRISSAATKISILPWSANAMLSRSLARLHTLNISIQCKIGTRIFCRAFSRNVRRTNLYCSECVWGCSDAPGHHRWYSGWLMPFVFSSIIICQIMIWRRQTRGSAIIGPKLRRDSTIGLLVPLKMSWPYIVSEWMWT